MGSETVLSQLYHAARITLILWYARSALDYIIGSKGSGVGVPTAMMRRNG